MVFGENPRVPRSMLSDDVADDVGVEDLRASAVDQDTAAAAFARAHQLRSEAQRALAAHDARDRLAE
eukprot:8630387-Pyramimonas_sp.AAC.1